MGLFNFVTANVNLWDYAVVDSYGHMMAWTAAPTKAECIEKFCENGKCTADEIPRLGSAVVRIAPVFVEGDERHHFCQPSHLEFLAKGKTE